MRNPNTGEVSTILKPGQHGQIIFPLIPGMPGLRLHPQINLCGGTLYHVVSELEMLSCRSLELSGSSSLLRNSDWVTGTVMVWSAGEIPLKIVFLAAGTLKSELGYPKLAIALLNPQYRLLLWRTTFLSMSSKTPHGNISSREMAGKSGLDKQIPLIVH